MSARSSVQLMPGINIQIPWSELLLSGQKTIETRHYPIPLKFIGVDLALIQTPGKRGNGKSMIVGSIRFSKCFQYESLDDWNKDYSKHLVSSDHPDFRWVTGKPKWGWVVESVRRARRLTSPPAPRGIVFSRECEVSL